MGDERPSRWEGTHLYSKHTPGRRARTASLVRVEAAAKLREEREKKKLEAEERRRSLSVGSLSANMSGAKAGPKAKSTGKSGLPGPTTTRTQPSPGPSTESRDPTPSPGETGDGPTSAGDDVGVVAPGIDPNTAAFFYAMESRLQTAAKKTVDDVSNLFQRNIERIDNNTKAIAELKVMDKQLENRVVDLLSRSEERAIAREKKLESRITAAIAKKLDQSVNATSLSTRAAVATGATVALSVPQQERREASYNYCRRSLKAWPVQGDDLNDAFMVFLKTKLRVANETIANLGPITVSKRPGRVAEQKLEVLAVFDSLEDRDLIKASGPNLAGQENVGLMIHVPGFLLDSLHALNNVGYHIKQNHQGVRRSVKFDDENMSIYMDIKICDQWKRITPAEAKQVVGALPSTGGKASRNLSVEDLSALVQGDAVAGLNVTEIPADE